MAVCRYRNEMSDIRTAMQSDAVALRQLHREAVFANAVGRYPRTELEAWAPGGSPNRAAQVKQEIADPDFIVPVAEVKAEAFYAGFLRGKRRSRRMPN
jgi:hypothetical protein